MEKPKRRSNGSAMAVTKRQRLRPAAADDRAAAAQAMPATKSRIEPNIIYAVSPRLYHADLSNFSSVVQILTGCAETRLRCKDMAILEDILDEDAKSLPSCGTADSPRSFSSPCSSISSSTTSAAMASASPLQGIGTPEINSDHSGSIAESIADDEVNWREMLQEISSPSTSWSSGGGLLQLDRFFGRVSAEQHGCFPDATMDLQTAIHRSSVPCWHAQGTEATFMEMSFKEDWISVCVQDDYSSNSSFSGYMTH